MILVWRLCRICTTMASVRLQFELERNESGSLGLQVAGSEGRVRIQVRTSNRREKEKREVRESKVAVDHRQTSSWSSPAVGRRLARRGEFSSEFSAKNSKSQVNGEPTEGCTHAQVVSLLKNGGEKVRGRNRSITSGTLKYCCWVAERNQ